MFAGLYISHIFRWYISWIMINQFLPTILLRKKVGALERGRALYSNPVIYITHITHNLLKALQLQNLNVYAFSIILLHVLLSFATFKFVVFILFRFNRVILPSDLMTTDSSSFYCQSLIIHYYYLTYPTCTLWSYNWLFLYCLLDFQ